MATHCAYSGVGGTGSFVSELCPRLRGLHGNAGGVVFYGVEPLHPDYARRLTNAGVSYCEVIKRPGIDLASRRALAQALRRSATGGAVVMHGGGTAWQWPLLRALGVRNRMAVVEHGPEWAISSAGGFLRHAISIFCADAVIAVSERLAEHLKSSFPTLLRNKPLYVIPNGIDTDYFKPAAGGRSRGSVLMVGTLSPTKDHATLIRAVALVSPQHSIRLLLAGDGMLRQELERLAGEIGIRDRVTFLGNVGREELLGLYREATVFAFASKGEGSPLALLEAMSCGLPVLASDVPGVREVLATGERGLLVPPDQPAKMARAIDRVLNDAEFARRMGTNARQYVEKNHSAARMADQYMEVLNAL